MIGELVVIGLIPNRHLYAILLQTRVIVSVLRSAHRQVVIWMHHHHRGIFSVKLVRHQVTCVTGSFRSKYALDFLNCLLLFHVSLTKALQYTLLVSFKSACFAILLTNLDDLLFDHFVFVLADLRPPLGCHFLGSLPDPQLCGLNLSTSLLLLLHVFDILLLLSLHKSLCLLFDRIGIHSPQLGQVKLRLLCPSRNRAIREDARLLQHSRHRVTHCCIDIRKLIRSESTTFAQSNLTTRQVLIGHVSFLLVAVIRWQ